MRPHRPPPEKPPGDDRHAYGQHELERLTGLPASAVRSLARAGHIQPIKRGRRLHYSFEDLLMMRTAKALRAAKIPARRITRTLRTFRSALPTGLPSQRRSLTSIGSEIIVREGQLTWESESGQYVLALDGPQSRTVAFIEKRQERGESAASADELYLKALALEDSDMEAAQVVYQHALNRDHEHIESLINLGRLLHLGGQLAEAERIYRTAVRPEPLLLFNLAVLLEDTDRLHAAMDAYRDALALDPNLADAQFNLARLYEGAGDSQASLRHLLAYRRLQRNSVE